MFQVFKRHLDQFHVVGLGLALVLLVTVAFLTYAGWQQYEQSSDETHELTNMIRSTQVLALQLEQAEIADQRFLLTGDTSILSEYVRIRADVHKQELALAQFQAGPGTRSSSLGSFEEAVDQELVALDQSIQARNRLSLALVLAAIREQDGIMSRVTASARAIELSRRSELLIGRNRTRHYAEVSQVTATLGCLCIFVIVFLSTVRIQTLLQVRTKLNQDLADMTDELRLLADSVPQLVLRMNERGDVEYLNQRWAEFSGEAIPETKSWQELLHPKDRDKFLRELDETVGRKTGMTAECRLHSRASGTFHWFLFRASPGAARQAPDWKLYGTFTDINQLKRMELALQRANEDLEQFSYAAAHDLQEPLRNIANCLSLLRHETENEFGEDPARWMYESVQNTERMREMVKDLLTFSKAVGRWPVDYPVLDANQVLQDAMANLREAIDESGAEIIACDLPSVRIQRLHLLQVFQNLIGNSLKYRKKDLAPMITVSARREEDDWIFSVADNGIGFDSHYAQRIFGMFKRLHSKGEYAGTGIGLSICARIVAHYGGRIWGEGQPGNGATFRFALPVHEDHSGKDLTAETTWRPSTGHLQGLAS